MTLWVFARVLRPSRRNQKTDAWHLNPMKIYAPIPVRLSFDGFRKFIWIWRITHRIQNSYLNVALFRLNLDSFLLIAINAVFWNMRELFLLIWIRRSLPHIRRGFGWVPPPISKRMKSFMGVLISFCISTRKKKHMWQLICRPTARN